MKTVLFGTLLGLTLWQPAGAAIRTFDFTATVSTLGKTGGPSGQASLPGWLAGSSVAQGDLVSGRFTLDDGTAPSVTSGTTADFDYSLNNGTLAFSFPRSGLNGSTADTYLSTYRAGTTASFELQAYHPDGALATFRLGNWDLAPSTPFSLGALKGGGLGAFWDIGAFERGYFGASLNSLVEVSPVPEPSTPLMLAGGLALLGAASRRRRRR